MNGSCGGARSVGIPGDCEVQDERLKISHLFGPAAAAVTALVLLTPGVAAAQAWTVVPSPNPGTGGTDQLNGVASVSANDVWAVGTSTTSAFETLAEHWNGTAWTVVPTPSPAGGKLNGVASASANDVWAVGVVSFSDPPVILHWDGIRWASVAHPRQTGFLSGVSAVSANDVWAVGESQVPGVGLQTLIEHWNGRKWSVVPSPNIGPMDQLRAVTAVSANDVWAVGFAKPTATSAPQTLILHWDGTSWTVVPSPNPAGAGDNELLGVTAVSATDVWAVGQTGNGAQTLTEHWDGISWAAVSSPSPGRLAGVAAVSASDVWAVGAVSDINGVTSTVIEQWNGTSWSVVPSPNPSASENVLAAASADPASGQAWAVGEFFNNTTSARQTLTEFNP